MKTGLVPRASRARRGWTTRITSGGLALVVGLVGWAGSHPAQGRTGMPPGGGQPAAAFDVITDLPVPPPLPPASPPEAAAASGLERTTPTAPEATTTTTEAPPPTTTTTTVATTPPSTAAVSAGTPAPAPVRRAAAVSGTGPVALAQVEAIADGSGWNWRAAGVKLALGFAPGACCHWGVYEAATSTVWVGPTAFADPARLRYVVLHELAHAWQYRQHRFADFIADYSAWGFATIGPALEAGADCVATVWGAKGGHYWNCVPEARSLAVRRLAGDWR